jgi:hypothetical protein
MALAQRIDYSDREKFLTVSNTWAGTPVRLHAKLNTNLTPAQRLMFGERLERLHNYLKKVKHYQHESLVTEAAPKHPCKSTACAFGHAVVSGLFPEIKARFRWRTKDVEKDGTVSGQVMDFKTLYGQLRKMEQFDYSITDMEAAADEFFGPGVWNVIFEYDAYGRHNADSVTKAAVLKRIRDVAEKGFGYTITTKR